MLKYKLTISFTAKLKDLPNMDVKKMAYQKAGFKSHNRFPNP